ncbi:hypothetical protein GUJ93_ZPchr0014g47667 [Zizania palustris]|uniref:Uncharacterized protein n=1 Tax=Zizania palustris TaxID=103762 RepID=A0A8J5TKP2_ZIZPA|nr:hypothetical protein GUJ93_ZPchr0014g47667 [Zizania palustris]
MPPTAPPQEKGNKVGKVVRGMENEGANSERWDEGACGSGGEPRRQLNKNKAMAGLMLHAYNEKGIVRIDFSDLG